MHDELYKVDLTDPVRLRSTLDAYLSLKVCPVDAGTRPPLLFPTTIEILLPDGSSMTRWGTVIRYMGASGFLVQFEGPMELGNLEALAAATADAPAEPAAEPTAPTPLQPEPEPEPPRFGPTVDVFVAGPDPGSPPEAPDEPAPFNAERTTLHEADEVLEAEAASAGDADPFADLVEGAPTGPATEAAAEVGIPDGWSFTGEFDLPAPEQTVSDRPITDVGMQEGDTDAPESSESYDLEDAPSDLEDDPPAALRGNESEMSAIYKQIQTLGPSEKQRLARSGNRITRGLLVKDRIKNIHQFVFRNPKITIEEIVEYVKLPGLSKDAVRIITSNRTWMASRQVAMGLVRNPATPVDVLPGLLQRLGPPQWRILAKSADVRPQVSSLAKKLLGAAGR